MPGRKEKTLTYEVGGGVLGEKQPKNEKSRMYEILKKGVLRLQEGREKDREFGVYRPGKRGGGTKLGGRKGDSKCETEHCVSAT